MRIHAINYKGLGNIISDGPVMGLSSKASVCTQNAIERLHWPLRLSSLQINDSFIKDLGNGQATDRGIDQNTRSSLFNGWFPGAGSNHLHDTSRKLMNMSLTMINTVRDAYASVDEFILSHQSQASIDDCKRQGCKQK